MKKFLLLLGLLVFIVPSLASSESLFDNILKKGQNFLNQIKGDTLLTCPPNWGVAQLFKINQKRKLFTSMLIMMEVVINGSNCLDRMTMKGKHYLAWIKQMLNF